MAPRFPAARSRPTDGAMGGANAGISCSQVAPAASEAHGWWMVDGGWRRMGAQGCCLKQVGRVGSCYYQDGEVRRCQLQWIKAGPGTSPIHAEWLSYDKTSFKSLTVRYPGKLCSCQLYVCMYVHSARVGFEWKESRYTWSSPKRTYITSIGARQTEFLPPPSWHTILLVFARLASIQLSLDARPAHPLDSRAPFEPPRARQLHLTRHMYELTAADSKPAPPSFSLSGLVLGRCRH